MESSEKEEQESPKKANDKIEKESDDEVSFDENSMESNSIESEEKPKKKIRKVPRRTKSSPNLRKRPSSAVVDNSFSEEEPAVKPRRSMRRRKSSRNSLDDDFIVDDDSPKRTKRKKTTTRKRKIKRSVSTKEIEIDIEEELGDTTRKKKKVKRQTSTTTRVKKEEELETHKWWEENDDWKKGEKKNWKWRTLEHNGVCFPPPYISHGIQMLYNGKEIKLTPEEEEWATYFARYLDTPHMEKAQFRKNFWLCWSEVLAEDHIIQDFDKCDFSPIHRHIKE
jgi:DNA topoisomerase-1